MNAEYSAKLDEEECRQSAESTPSTNKDQIMAALNDILDKQIEEIYCDTDSEKCNASVADNTGILLLKSSNRFLTESDEYSPDSGLYEKDKSSKNRVASNESRDKTNLVNKEQKRQRKRSNSEEEKQKCQAVAVSTDWVMKSAAFKIPNDISKIE